MFKAISRKLFGTRNDRLVVKYRKRAEKINAKSADYEAMSDDQLKANFEVLREQVNAVKDQGDEAIDRLLNDILEECFGLVREVAWRVLGEKPYLVQLVGAMVIHEGKIAEMMTGEGKTLTSTLPICLNALSGRGVFIITVNPYLAQRDREWMSPIYDFLGLTSGVILPEMGSVERKEAYAADITFGTNSEFGFDYLRDNMCKHFEEQVQGRRHFAIIDEVDSILIDEARTPLIISGSPQSGEHLYRAAQACVQQLKRDVDFEVDEKHHSVWLHEVGIEKCESILKIDNFYSPKHMEWPHLLENALKANHLFLNDKEYIVEDGEVVIVDENTGRKQHGRRWSDGLHQAIEVKEGLRVREETQTMATITIQNYFRMFSKLAGMTGTAFTEALEFYQIYSLDVVQIPTNLAIARRDEPDLIYGSIEDKHQAIAEKVNELYESKRPVLIGTTSVERSEAISNVLKKKGVPHNVLNAKNHEREAEFIMAAGQPGMVTIATNMAGRGTDIKLGEGVKDMGGLYVLGTERHESRRIDNQLRGRCGRQGDPGTTRFFLSLEDDLMRIFASDNMRKIFDRMGLKDGEVLESRMVTRAVENAQKKVEEHHFSMRKNLIEYDDVKNDQRKIIYQERQRILEGDDVRGLIVSLMEKSITSQASAVADLSLKNSYDLGKYCDWLEARFNIKAQAADFTGMSLEQICEKSHAWVHEAYDAKEKEIGDDLVHLHAYMALWKIDHKWKDHLRAMDHLRSGIGWRGQAGTDPKVAYRTEGFELFEEMIANLTDEVADLALKIQVTVHADELAHEEVAQLNTTRDQSRVEHTPRTASAGGKPTQETRGGAAPVVRMTQKVGRNDPCPCGSGKKYKKCHGG